MKKKFIVIFTVSLLFFAGIFWTTNKILDVMEITSKVEFLGSDLGNGNVIEQTVDNELLFLVLGLDSDDFSGYSTEQNRTDTMILAKVNFETGAINVLSIPRDSRVSINGNLDKINHAHHFGGLKLAMKTTRDFLNLDIDYYVRVNFFSVKDIVDALGGVEVNVPVQVDVPEDNVHLEPGLQKLNGKQALQFARFRDGYIEGDMGRVKSQQLLIKAMLTELTKAKNIAKIPELLEVFKKTVSTNIPFSTIAKLALKAGNLSVDKLDAKIVPGEAQYINDISYYVPNKVELKALVKSMFGDYLLKGTEQNQINEYKDNNSNTTNNQNSNQNNNNVNNQNNDNTNYNGEENQNTQNQPERKTFNNNGDYEEENNGN
ncbi:MAG: LCP family protein [Parvimonas sp.]|uniref:LCP family protein n=1 Tax=Parvimonas sp. TaxID=1944660 RepID=UPI0025CD8EB8|nr:LCP family protein [Parvimonas sp.]MCI5996806.1 LCP family protein [Parvimonas sp.]